MSLLFLGSLLMQSSHGMAVNSVPIDDESPNLDYAYGYPVMAKRNHRPTLNDYLRLAAIQYEMDKEEAEAADAQSAADALDVLPAGLPSGESQEPEAHSVEKRRRRYGFWVTAINKMGNVKRGVKVLPRGHPILMG